MHNEIDLGRVILNLWEGKWKILKSTIITFILGLVFVFFQPQPTYRAITEIKPLNFFKASEYNSNNSLNFFQITPQILFKLYIEQVESKSLFINVIKDLKIFKKSDYETEEDYNNEISRLASKIEILVTNDHQRDEDFIQYNQIVFSHTDEELWKNILKEFHKTNQKLIRNKLIKIFNEKLLSEKLKINFELEDIENQIDAEVLEYNLKNKIHLTFLEEQAQLARVLGIKTNTIKPQNFDGKNIIISVDTKTPYYFRGYESIEKEIILMKSRKEEKNYIKELVELEKKKYLLNKSKDLERWEEFFFKTPIGKEEKFIAVSLDIEETNFEYKYQKNKILILAILLGLFAGSIYVLSNRKH